jgi:sterol desaturase/sphingolipid hydroxylase (fatty acid hydroxylase superfamily)
MKTRLAALAVPAFLALIATEVAIARARKRRVYRVADAIADLGCGIVELLLRGFLVGTAVGLYGWVYDNARLVTWSSRAVPWAIALVGVDFLYYWWHRLSHEVNVMWAAHSVHHQSEDYNFAVALRQALLTAYTHPPFNLPLALLGVPPVTFAVAAGISTIYQLWIHTELVGRLGRLEGWLNTPSHHRVHHAINPQYLDKNHGAILIVWDRLFGTFAREQEPCVYGVVKPLDSFNPLWAQFQPLVALAVASARAPRLVDKLRIWVASPASGQAMPADASYLQRPKYDPVAPPRVVAYVVAQFAVAVVVTAALLVVQKDAPRAVLAAGTAFVVVTLVASSGLLEGRRWAKPVEAARIALALVGSVALAIR